MDAIGETIVSIAQVLCDEGVPYQIGWYDRENSHVETREILNADDLNGALAGVLSASLGEDSQSIISHFEEDKGALEYAHIILVGSRQEAMMEAPFCEGMVTDLVCIEEQKPSQVRTAGGQIIYFTPETMTEDLFYIEV